MAGTVLSRTCFYQRVGGTIRPFEWCVINYEGFGPMVEPYWPFECNNTAVGNHGTKQNDDFSTASDFQRVDEFVEVDEATLIKSLNSGTQDTWMHGGRNYPRSGR
jgi:hypothetical protein